MEKMNIEELKNSMNSNGYAYFDDEAFKTKSDKICYIPENAEELDECYNYASLKKEVEKWLEDNLDYLEEHETTIENLIVNVYENLTWEFPSTYLEGLDY